MMEEVGLVLKSKNGIWKLFNCIKCEWQTGLANLKIKKVKSNQLIIP